MSRALLALSVLTAPAFAFAQAEEEPAPEPRVVYAQKTELDFEALRLSAEVADDGLEYVIERRRASFHPMIELRRDFAAELLASVDEVR